MGGIDLRGIAGGAGAGVANAYPTFMSQKEETKRKQMEIEAAAKLKDAELAGKVAETKATNTANSVKDAQAQVQTLAKNWGADAGKSMQSAYDALIAGGMDPTQAAGQLGTVVSHYDDMISTQVDATNKRLGGSYIDKAEARNEFYGELPTQFRPTKDTEAEKALAGREGQTYDVQTGTGNKATYQIQGGKDVKVGEGPVPAMVNVDQRAENAGDAAFNTLVAKRADDLVGAGAAANQKLADLGQVGQLLDAYEAAGGSPGAFAQAKVGLGSVLNNLGLTDLAKQLNAAKDQTEFGQALAGASNKLIGGLIGTGPNALLPANTFTEADRNLILSVVPGLGDLNGSFRLKLLALQKVQQRAQEMASSFWGRIDSGMGAVKAYQQTVAEFEKKAKDNPTASVFSPEELAAIKNAGAPKAAAPPPAAGSPFPGFTFTPATPPATLPLRAQ